MDKEDIMQKAREEGTALDERERSIHQRSFGFGMAVVAILCVLFSVVKSVQGEGFYEFGVILFAYLAAIHFYQFFHLNIKKSLFTGIICAAGSVVGLIGFFLLG